MPLIKQLSSRLAPIKGGANGIGRATVELFAKEGARVAYMDKDVAAGLSVREDMAAMMNNAESVFFVTRAVMMAEGSS